MGWLEGELIRSGAVLFGEFRLTSGGVSHVYVDMRKVIGDPRLFRLISLELSHRLLDIGCGDCVAVGVATGGVPWASAIALELGLPLAYARHPKGHGTERDLEGAEVSSRGAVVIDDVATTGGSLAFAVKVAKSHGAREVIAEVIVDRGQGAREALEQMGVRLLSLTTLRDILSEALRLKVIDEARLRSIEEELWGQARP
ncbi:MAG: phosphoribosyltransferase family protein [Acidilobus sp.]